MEDNFLSFVMINNNCHENGDVINKNISEYESNSDQFFRQLSLAFYGDKKSD